MYISDFTYSIYRKLTIEQFICSFNRDDIMKIIRRLKKNEKIINDKYG